ncbi:MAG: aldo/keto reductase [Dehalococcoidia bacterium]
MSHLRTRRLGRTGLMVTELGLGAMDTPHSDESHATIEAALDGGITFIDTARDYEGSEFLIGEVVRARGGLPDGVYLESKTFSHTAAGAQRDIDRGVSFLGVPQIAVYQLHDISTPEAWAEVRAEDGALEGLQVAQYRGLIGHIGVSCHSTDLLRELITSDVFDAVMLEYSAFFTETAPMIELANEHDVGVIVMRPLGGSGRTSVMRGRIDEGVAGLLTPANLLRYVLAHPGVSVAIPGARRPSRIHANIATATSASPMDEGERRELEEAAARLY